MLGPLGSRGGNDGFETVQAVDPVNENVLLFFLVDPLILK